MPMEHLHNPINNHSHLYSFHQSYHLSNSPTCQSNCLLINRHSHSPSCPGIPMGYIHNFCTGNSDWLEDEKGYYPWKFQMKLGFEYCKMQGVISGTETWPLVGLQLSRDMWDKKDRLVRVILSTSVKSESVIKISGAMTSKVAWTLFETEYSQTGSGSPMLWFRQLTRQLSPGGCISWCFWFPGSHPPSCQCWLSNPIPHCCYYPTLNTSIWSQWPLHTFLA